MPNASTFRAPCFVIMAVPVADADGGVYSVEDDGAADATGSDDDDNYSIGVNSIASRDAAVNRITGPPASSSAPLVHRECDFLYRTLDGLSHLRHIHATSTLSHRYVKAAKRTQRKKLCPVRLQP